jgi:hypothetical protein
VPRRARRSVLGVTRAKSMAESGCSEYSECPVDASFDIYRACSATRSAAARHRDGYRRTAEKDLSDVAPHPATVGDERAYVYRFTPLGECRHLFDERIEHKLDWGSSGSGFFDLDEWEKEPPADR